MEKAPEEHHSHALREHQDCGQKRPQFKGVRKRKWGSWGSEIWTPKTRAKIWLGSYKTAEQAARAYDAAVYCLRGPNAEFNFPSSVPAIPSASSLSPKEIQLVAARYARDEIPSISTSNSPSPQNNNNKAGDEHKYPSRSSLVSETAIASESRQQISEEWDMAWWDCLFDGNSCIDLEKFPSIDVALGLDASQAWQEEEQDGYLWNLWEVSITHSVGRTGNISAFQYKKPLVASIRFRVELLVTILTVVHLQ